MSQLVLPPGELVEITGYSLPKYQRQWLDQHGWRYVQNRAGYPVVARDHALQQLGVKVADDQSTQGYLPDFSAIASKGRR